jgi:DNA-binding response OmpR family regulator
MPAMTRVLVVEDEPQIVRVLRDYLQHSGFDVLTATDGPSALRAVRTGKPDLMVLDLGLPGMDGLDVARAVRREGELPIIMLTARTEEADRVAGLELGADDYVPKPFSPRELVARVRAVLRRSEGRDPAQPTLRVGSEIEVDRARREFRVAGRLVDLTPTEFDLLETMARQPGRVFTRAQLLDAIRGTEVESYQRAIDAHVKNIRRKLEADPRAPRYLQTVFGVGYRFADLA